MPESEFPAVLNKRLVLIVEDDPILLKNMAACFTAAGCAVMTAGDGVIGLKRFEENRPDVVITDIIMPDREGVETIMSMKTHDPSVPILAISGSGDLLTATAGLLSGEP